MVQLVFLSVFQTYTAVYYVIADLMMLALYLYYMTKNRMRQRKCAFCSKYSVSQLKMFFSLCHLSVSALFAS